MFNCCCSSRRILIIYGIVISGITFIYEIAVISNFGSRTNNYKILREEIKLYEDIKETDSNFLELYYEIYDFYLLTDDMKEFLNKFASDYDNLERYSYGMIKRLKGIENGFVIIFFIFTIIFIAVEIVYLYFSCGICEYQLLKVKTYKILNILKIITLIFSSIFVLLSICFTVMVQVSYIQYFDFVDSFDKCLTGIMMDIFLGYYNFFFYLNLDCIFYKELTLFRKVGSESSPGENAAYDVNGNPIIRTMVQGQQIISTNQQMINHNVNLYSQQVRIYNIHAQQAFPTSNEEQIQQNQMTQEQVAIKQSPTSTQRFDNEEARDNNA